MISVAVWKLGMPPFDGMFTGNADSLVVFWVSYFQTNPVKNIWDEFFWVPPPTTFSIDGPKPWRPVVFTLQTRTNSAKRDTKEYQLTKLPLCGRVFASGGGTAPVVVHVFENTHFWPGCGGGVNVHVKLRHMHMLRHVTGWGGGVINVHVNLRHIHMLRHVTGLGGVNIHVNLRHIHMLRQVTGLVGC